MLHLLMTPLSLFPMRFRLSLTLLATAAFASLPGAGFSGSLTLNNPGTVRSPSLNPSGGSLQLKSTEPAAPVSLQGRPTAAPLSFGSGPVLAPQPRVNFDGSGSSSSSSSSSIQSSNPGVNFLGGTATVPENRNPAQLSSTLGRTLSNPGVKASDVSATPSPISPLLATPVRAVQIKDGFLPIVWGESAATVVVPEGVYQVTVEHRAASGAWQPFRVSHFTGEGGVFSISLGDLTNDQTSYRAWAYTRNKFANEKKPPVVVVPPVATPIGTPVSGIPTLTVSDSVNVIAALRPPETLVISAGNMFIGGISKGISAGTLELRAATSTLTQTAVVTNSVSGSQIVGLLSNSATSQIATSIDRNTAAPVAVESDIWKFAGNRLFYFNQFRGLQVIDIHDPVRPVKVGTLRMPAVGDQIQVLDAEGSRIALLSRSSTSYWRSQIKLVAVAANGEPRLVRTIELDGYLGETRLIGSRLYAMISGYWSSQNILLPGSATIRLQGYDLADFENPVNLGYAEGTGFQPLLQSAGRYLLLGSSTYDQRSIIHAIDFSEDGRPSLVKRVTLTGSMGDQFKMSVVNGAIVGVSAIKTRWVWGTRVVETNGDTTTVRQTYTIYPAQTWVETFDLNAEGAEPLARMHLDDAEGETLYATRFDGQRLYVVTYGVRQNGPRTFDYTYSYSNLPRPCDPLFIIDLDDPAQPRLRGQLIIPGYSTFIEPMGDRLLSVGLDENRVAASLFDVSNPDAPSLLSRVFPGAADDAWWTTSEALSEHRAVTWLPAQNKFIVPYSLGFSYNPQGATQEVNFTRTALTLGDVVHTVSTARRGTSIAGHLLTISSRELVVAKDSNGGGIAAPVKVLELAWPVDRVAAVGDYLIEIEASPLPCQYDSGWYWPQNRPSAGSSRSGKPNVLRLTRRSNTEHVLDSVELPGESSAIIGTTVRGGRLYVAQWVSSGNYSNDAVLRTFVLRPAGDRLVQDSTATTTLPLTELLMTGSVNFAGVQPVWVKDNQLVWYIPCGQRVYDYWWQLVRDGLGPQWIYNGCCWCYYQPEISPEEEARRVRIAQGWGNTISALLCPVTVGDRGAISVPAAPLSIPGSPGETRLLGASRAFTDNGWFFFSSTQEVEEDGSLLDEDMVSDGEYEGGSWSFSSWVNRSTTQLHALNFNEPVVIDELQSAAIPGTLLGASEAERQGAWLICNRRMEYNGVLSLAYDGLSVRRRDVINSYANMSTSDSRGGSLFVASGSNVENFRQNQRSGKFERLASLKVLDGSGYSYLSTVRISGQCLMLPSHQRLSVARIYTNRTLGLLGSASFPGYSAQPVVDRAVLDPRGTGAWVPASDYGVERLIFDHPDTLVAGYGED